MVFSLWSSTPTFSKTTERRDITAHLTQNDVVFAVELAVLPSLINVYLTVVTRLMSKKKNKKTHWYTFVREFYYTLKKRVHALALF